jgi:hypothetical protein
MSVSSLFFNRCGVRRRRGARPYHIPQRRDPRQRYIEFHDTAAKVRPNDDALMETL